MTTEDKSLDRTKNTASSFTQIAIKCGFKLVPGGEILYEGVKHLVEHGINFNKDRVNERLDGFHKALFSGLKLDEFNDFCKKEFSLEEYYSLLSSVVNDDEDEKIYFYSKLFYYLTIGLIPTNERKYLVRIFKRLSISDLEMIRIMHIHTNCEFEDSGVKRSQIQEITLKQDPIHQFSIQNLVSLGLLEDKDGTRPYWPTPMLKNIAEKFFTNEQLTPESIGRKILSPVDVIIFKDGDSIKGEFFARIQDCLEKLNLASKVIFPDQFEKLQETAKCFVFPFSKQIPDSFKTEISKKTAASIPFIQIQLSGSKPVIYTRYSGVEYPIDIYDDSGFIVFVEEVKRKLKIP